MVSGHFDSPTTSTTTSFSTGSYIELPPMVGEILDFRKAPSVVSGMSTNGTKNSIWKDRVGQQFEKSLPFQGSFSMCLIEIFTEMQSKVLLKR